MQSLFNTLSVVQVVLAGMMVGALISDCRRFGFRFALWELIVLWNFIFSLGLLVWRLES